MYSSNLSLIFLFITAFQFTLPPVSAAVTDITWKVPAEDDPYTPMTANVGDSVSFTWGSGHDVHIHPSGTCDEAGAKLVSDTPGATYTFKEADVGKVVFACDVKDHCAEGQIITFTVKSSTPTAPTASPPVASPVASPVSEPTVSGGVHMKAPMKQCAIMMSLLYKFQQFF